MTTEKFSPRACTAIIAVAALTSWMLVILAGASIVTIVTSLGLLP